VVHVDIEFQLTNNPSEDECPLQDIVSVCLGHITNNNIATKNRHIRDVDLFKIHSNISDRHKHKHTNVNLQDYIRFRIVLQLQVV